MYKIFISQPMNGLTNEQINAYRERTVKVLTDKGYEIIDSVFDFEDVENVKNKSLFYLSKSLELIAKEANYVYFMDGWEDARGCRLEHECCKEYSIPIMYAKDYRVG